MKAPGRYAATLVALALFVALTVVAAVAVWRAQTHDDRVDSRIIANHAATEVLRSANAPLATVAAAEGFLTANPDATPVEFHRFGAAALSDTPLVRLDYYAATPAVAPGPVRFRLALSAGGSDGAPDDLSEVREVVEAAALSTRTGRTAITTPIDAGTGGPTVAAVAAVYAGPVTPLTAPERLRMLRGFVAGRVKVATMARIVSGGLPPGTDIQVSDGGMVLGGDAGRSGRVLVNRITLGGREWTVRTWPPAFRHPKWMAGLILLLGLSVAGAGLLLTRQGMRRERLADRRVGEAMGERDRAEAELRDSERRFRALASGAPSGIFQLGPDGQMNYANQTWLTLAGQDWEQARGRGWVSAIHPEDVSKLVGWEQRAAGGRGNDTQFRFLTPTGGVRWVMARTMPIVEEGADAPVGWIGSVTDITDRIIAEARLADSEAMYRATVEGAAEAIITLDADGTMVSVNPAACALFGRPADAMVGASITTVIPEATDPDHQPGGRVAGVRADGTVVPVHMAVSRTRTGDTPRLTAILRDLTVELAAEARVTLHAREQTALREVATLVAAQASVVSVAGLTAEQVARMSGVDVALVLEFVHDGESAAVLRGKAGAPLDLPLTSHSRLVVPPHSLLGRLRATGVAVRGDGDPTSEAQGCIALGVPRAIVAPIIVEGRVWGGMLLGNLDERPIPEDAEGRLAHFASLISLAVSAQDARDKLAHLASTDHLTDLANRRAFHERLHLEAERATRHGRPLSLILLDLDHFKEINDTYGHEAGDRVLSTVADRLRQQIRAGEMLGRLGGEEFGWLLPGTGAEEALRAAERAREAICGMAVPGSGRVTASLGVSELGPGGVADLMQGADTALYRAKDLGRNRSILDDPLLTRLQRRADHPTVVPFRQPGGPTA